MKVKPEEVHVIMRWRALRDEANRAVELDHKNWEDLMDAAALARPAAMRAERDIARRAYPVRKRVAELTVWLCDRLCALTGHAGACWMLNRGPLCRVWGWGVCFADFDVFSAVLDASRSGE